MPLPWPITAATTWSPLCPPWAMMLTIVALEALKAAGSTDPGDVMAALPSVTYTGVTGEISFNETGDANRDTAYIKKVNTETGVWDFVAEQKVS